MSTMKDAVESVVREVAQPISLVDYLTGEQRAALESKFNTLDQAIRSSVASKYPGRKPVELYLIRQMVKDANSRLASQHRPIWLNKLTINAVSLQSSDKNVAEYAEKQLRDLAEELDSKESATLLKRYKQQHDRTSDDPFIKRLCGIFGIESAVLK